MSIIVVVEVSVREVQEVPFASKEKWHRSTALVATVADLKRSGVRSAEFYKLVEDAIVHAYRLDDENAPE